MKTIMSQCLSKAKKRKKNTPFNMAKTHTDDCHESCDVSRNIIEMARTFTEARENPDRMLCLKL